MVSEVYTALKAAGVEDELARAAAKSVMAIEDKALLATRGDVAELRAEMRQGFAELKSELTKTMVTMIIAMTAIFSAISAALRFVK
jgi:hypothetical protein